MKLKKKQKEYLLLLIAEGLQSDEINERLAAKRKGFTVTRNQVAYYRRTRAVNLEVIERLSEDRALVEGYALKETRVRKLGLLAAKMEQDILGNGDPVEDDLLWLPNSKVIGSGPFSERIDYDEFNASEVAAYRGVLDDIAREVGDRRTKIDLTKVDFTKLLDSQLERLARGEDIIDVLTEPITSPSDG